MDRWKEMITEGKVLFGTHITNADMHNAEILGNCGYDYFWIDMEHTQITKHDVCNILLAARAAGRQLATFVRVPVLDAAQVKPILEMGPTGIIFPMISTPEEVRLAVEACCYPPKGIRGFSPRAAVRYGLDDIDEYVGAINDKIWKLVQIETRMAYENIDLFLENTDVDVFIMGPCDFSGAFGHLPDYYHPEVMEKIDEVFCKVRQAGRLIGVSVGAYDYESVKMWMEKGVHMISVGSEPAYMINGSRRALANLQKAYEDVHVIVTPTQNEVKF